MQYNAPKKVRLRGLIRVRYKIAFLLTGVVCLYEYQRVSCQFLPKIAADVMAPELMDLLNRQSSYPYNAIWLSMKLLPQVAAGRFAEICSAKWILFISVLLIGICLCMIPFAVGKIRNALLLDAVTGVMHLSYGCILPAAHVMLSRWSPPKERFTMGSTVYCSLPLGKALAVFINTWLSSVVEWQYVFYSSAAVYVIWLIVWVVAVHDDPSGQENISDDERQLLHDSLKDELYEHKRRIESVAPWKAILTSSRVWAITLIFTTTIHAWNGFNRQFEDDASIFRVDNQMHPLNEAVILTMPYIWSPVITILFGLTFFNLTQHTLRKVQAYRIGTVISLIGGLIHVPFFIYRDKIPGYCLIINSLLVLTTTGFMATSFMLHLDIAPNYAGTLMGVTNSVADLPELIFIAVGRGGYVDNLENYFSIATTVLSLFMGIVYFPTELEDWNNHCHLLEGEDSDIDY